MRTSKESCEKRGSFQVRPDGLRLSLARIAGGRVAINHQPSTLNYSPYSALIRQQVGEDRPAVADGEGVVRFVFEIARFAVGELRDHFLR